MLTRPQGPLAVDASETPESKGKRVLTRTRSRGQTATGTCNSFSTSRVLVDQLLPQLQVLPGYICT